MKKQTPKRKPKTTVLPLDRLYSGLPKAKGGTMKLEFKDHPKGGVGVQMRHVPPGGAGSFITQIGIIDRRKLALFALRLVKRHGIEADDS